MGGRSQRQAQREQQCARRSVEFGASRISLRTFCTFNTGCGDQVFLRTNGVSGFGQYMRSIGMNSPLGVGSQLFFLSLPGDSFLEVHRQRAIGVELGVVTRADREAVQRIRHEPAAAVDEILGDRPEASLPVAAESYVRHRTDRELIQQYCFLCVHPAQGASPVTTSEFAAESLVFTYLSGRTMEPILFRAVVWMAEKRLTSGMMPVLDATMRKDIDNQAGATQWRSHSSQAWSEAPTVCALLHRAYVLSPPMPDPISTLLHRASHRTVGRNSERHSRG